MSDAQEITEKLTAFLAGQMARIDFHQVNKVQVAYTPTGGYRSEPLRSWSRSSPTEVSYFADEAGHPNMVMVAAMASEIMEIAENQADSMGGSNRYRFTVRCHHQVGGYEAHTFVLKPAPPDLGEAMTLGSGEGASKTPEGHDLVPTGTGQIGQLMRHVENLNRQNKEMMQVTMQAVASFGGQLRDENDRLRDENSKLIDERRKLIGEVEAARTEENNRDIASANAVASNDRRDFAMKRIMGLLPVAVMAMSRGKKKSAKPAKLSPLALHMAKLFDSLSDDQKDQIEAALGIEQKITLGSILEAIQEPSEESMALLFSLVEDLTGSLTPDQVRRIMSGLTADQGKMFVAAMHMAKAQETASAAATPIATVKKLIVPPSEPEPS